MGPPLQNNLYLAYEAFGQPVQMSVNLVDQFGIWDFIVSDHDCRCVPSWTRQVVRTEEKTRSEIRGLYRD